MVLLHHGKLELWLELISKTRDSGPESVVVHTGAPFTSEKNTCFKLLKGNLSYCSVTERIIQSINQKDVKEFLHLGLNFHSDLHRFSLIILFQSYFHKVKDEYLVSDLHRATPEISNTLTFTTHMTTRLNPQIKIISVQWVENISSGLVP